MHILLGAPVWYGNRPFTRTVEELYKLDLDYLEFSLDYPLPDCMGKTGREELKELLKEFGMKIAFHSPLDISVAHPRGELADASMAILRRCMDFSADFMPLSLYYNFHLHPRVSTYTLEDVREELKIKGLRRCEAITRMASEFGILTSVENDLVPFEWSDLILEALSAPDLYLTFDIGHAIMAEMHHSKMQNGSYLDYIARWIEKCGPKIQVVHLHDCALTEKQDHLSIGAGELDFDAVFDLLKRTNCKYIVIETFWRNKEKEEMNYEELKRNVEFCRCYL
ncbi:MAG TPA: sugar phosphate isomerase/epimerase [Methanophagales archaeon]|nr:sugar phosphate isomerase/epimerase [Methanophagales archaeon]